MHSIKNNIKRKGKVVTMTDLTTMSRQELIAKAMELGSKNAKFLGDPKLIAFIAKAEGRELTVEEAAKIAPVEDKNVFVPTNMKKIQSFKVKVRLIETGEEKIVPVKEYSEDEALERARKIADGQYEVIGVEKKVSKDVTVSEGTKIFALKGKFGDQEVKVEVATKDLEAALALAASMGLTEVSGDQKYKVTTVAGELKPSIDLEGKSKTEVIKEHLRTGAYSLKDICARVGCRPTQVYTAKKTLEDAKEIVPPMLKA
jgi:hypothetical protein